MNCKAQEEMVGFAVIVVIVAVIIMVFLSFSLRAPEQGAIQSYEIDNFIQSVLYYTLEDNVDIRDLIRDCKNYEEDCDVLETELKAILDESWIVEEGSVIKGYRFSILDGAPKGVPPSTKNKDLSEEGNKEIFNVEKGEVTQNYKSGTQSDAELIFTVYY